MRISEDLITFDTRTIFKWKYCFFVKCKNNWNQEEV